MDNEIVEEKNELKNFIINYSINLKVAPVEGSLEHNYTQDP